MTKGPCPQFGAPSPARSPRALPRWPLNHCRLIKGVGQLRWALVGLLGRELNLDALCGDLLLSRPRLAWVSGCPHEEPGVLGGRGAAVGGRVATTLGTPRIGRSVGGCGWANEALHCQGELEELRQVLGEVSFVGWAEPWPRAMCAPLGPWSLPY